MSAGVGWGTYQDRTYHNAGIFRVRRSGGVGWWLHHENRRYCENGPNHLVTLLAGGGPRSLPCGRRSACFRSPSIVKLEEALKHTHTHAHAHAHVHNKGLRSTRWIASRVINPQCHCASSWCHGARVCVSDLCVWCCLLCWICLRQLGSIGYTPCSAPS